MIAVLEKDQGRGSGGCGQPLVSVDVVALSWSGDVLRFALHERQNEPFAGVAALPGVLLLPGETLAAAVRRAASSKLGLPERQIVHVGQVGAFDGTNRDPRGATISIAHLAVADSSAHELPLGSWVTAAEGLPFDHGMILTSAFARLGQLLWQDWELTRALLGEEFTTRSALALSHRLDALPNRASNIARWLESTERVQRVGQNGRAAVWRWVSPVQ